MIHRRSRRSATACFSRISFSHPTSVSDLHLGKRIVHLTTAQSTTSSEYPIAYPPNPANTAATTAPSVQCPPKRPNKQTTKPAKAALDAAPRKIKAAIHTICHLASRKHDPEPQIVPLCPVQWKQGFLRRVRIVERCSGLASTDRVRPPPRRRTIQRNDRLRMRGAVMSLRRVGFAVSQSNHRLRPQHFGPGKEDRISGIIYYAFQMCTVCTIV